MTKMIFPLFAFVVSCGGPLEEGPLVATPTPAPTFVPPSPSPSPSPVPVPTVVVTETPDDYDPHHGLPPQHTYANFHGLEDLPEGWAWANWYNTSVPVVGSVSTFQPDGIRIQATGSTQTSIVHKPNWDTSDCSAITFVGSATINAQNLGGTGWYGREAPFAMAAQYTDKGGVIHNTLTAGPAAGEADDSGTTRMFWEGAFIKTGATNVGTLVTAGLPFVLVTSITNVAKLSLVAVNVSGWSGIDVTIHSFEAYCQK